MIILSSHPLVRFRRRMTTIMMFSRRIIEIVIHKIRIHRKKLKRNHRLLITKRPMSPSTSRLKRVHIVPRFSISTRDFRSLHTRNIRLAFHVIIRTRHTLLFIISTRRPFNLNFNHTIVLYSSSRRTVIPRRARTRRITKTNRTS